MNIQTLKGFRDFLPAEARKRQYVINTLKRVFESYGFEPLETPVLEYGEILAGKYGDEGDQLMYRFKDRGDRDVAMRYDQTVPLARVVAQYGSTGSPQISFPFKRFQISPVWRAENTQKGRYREFLQCDIDTVGTDSPMADAEILAVVTKSLEALGLKFKILINTKEILYALMTEAGINKEKWIDTAITLDKIDKIGQDSAAKELIQQKGLSKGCVDELFRISPKIKNLLPNIKPLTNDNTILMDFKTLNSNIAPLKAIAREAIKLGIQEEILVPRFTLARGLNYYTGLIFEIEIEGYTAGSVCGGGRYDNLIGMFAGQNVPAVGCAFGFDRIIEAMEAQQLFPDYLALSTTKVLVTIFSDELKQKSLETASLLRNQEIPTEMYLGEIKDKNPLEKQLKYADQKNIPFVLIIGPEEAAKDLVTLKNLKTREQKQLTIDEVLPLLRDIVV